MLSIPDVSGIIGGGCCSGGVAGLVRTRVKAVAASVSMYKTLLPLIFLPSAMLCSLLVPLRLPFPRYLTGIKENHHNSQRGLLSFYKSVLSMAVEFTPEERYTYLHGFSYVLFEGLRRNGSNDRSLKCRPLRCDRSHYRVRD